MRPIPFAPVLEKLSLSDVKYGSVRRFYVETPEDNAIPMVLQESMINSNPPEKVFHLKGADHSPFFSKPQALHKLLVEISKIPSPWENLIVRCFIGSPTWGFIWCGIGKLFSGIWVNVYMCIPSKMVYSAQPLDSLDILYQSTEYFDMFFLSLFCFWFSHQEIFIFMLVKDSQFRVAHRAIPASFFPKAWCVQGRLFCLWLLNQSLL